MVLTKMKETAEAYLGHKVTHAVVTVPACEYGESRAADPGANSLNRLQRRSAICYQGCRHNRWSHCSPNRQRANCRRYR
jgi:hypothetical protein